MRTRAADTAHHPTSPLRVAFVLHEGNAVGGITSWSLRLAERLARGGVEAILLEHDASTPRVDANTTRVDASAHSRSTEIPNGSPTRLPVDGPRPQYVSAHEAERIARTYGQLLPVVLVPNVGEGAYGAAAALARTEADRIRVIGYAHADAHYYYELLAYYEAMIHTFVAVSPAVGARLTACLPHRAEDIRIRPYCVPIGEPPSRPVRMGAPLRLLYAGRLVEWQKRVTLLADLAIALGEAGVHFELRILGEGPSRATLERRLKSAPTSVRERVSLHNPLPPSEMSAAWDRADVCVLTSDHEGVSISMLEAMARGCVPVVTRTSGTELMVQEGVSGFTVPVDDPLAMVGVLKRLAEDPSLLAAVGEGARHAAALHCSEEAYEEWFVGLLQEAWQQPPRPWPSERSLVIPPGLEGPLPVRLLSRVIWKIPGVYGPARRFYRRFVDV